MCDTNDCKFVNSFLLLLSKQWYLLEFLEANHGSSISASKNSVTVLAPFLSSRPGQVDGGFVRSFKSEIKHTQCNPLRFRDDVQYGVWLCEGASGI